MAKIVINDLQSASYSLENSFTNILQELTDIELISTKGGDGAILYYELWLLGYV